VGCHRAVGILKFSEDDFLCGWSVLKIELSMLIAETSLKNQLAEFLALINGISILYLPYFSELRDLGT